MPERPLAEALTEESREAAAVSACYAVERASLQQRLGACGCWHQLVRPLCRLCCAQEHVEDAGDASRVKGDTLTERSVLEGRLEGPSTST